MKILVCGGRAYRDHAKVFDVLDAVDRHRPIKALIQGGENGADAIAREWAQSRHVKLRTPAIPAGIDGEEPWMQHNQQMLDRGQPTLVIAFPGAHRTADMVRRAKAIGVTVLEIE